MTIANVVPPSPPLRPSTTSTPEETSAAEFDNVDSCNLPLMSTICTKKEDEDERQPRKAKRSHVFTLAPCPPPPPSTTDCGSYPMVIDDESSSDEDEDDDSSVNTKMFTINDEAVDPTMVNTVLNEVLEHHHQHEKKQDDDEEDEEVSRYTTNAGLMQHHYSHREKMQHHRHCENHPRWRPSLTIDVSMMSTRGRSPPPPPAPRGHSPPPLPRGYSLPPPRGHSPPPPPPPMRGQSPPAPKRRRDASQFPSPTCISATPQPLPVLQVTPIKLTSPSRRKIMKKRHVCFELPTTAYYYPVDFAERKKCMWYEPQEWYTMRSQWEQDISSFVEHCKALNQQQSETEPASKNNNGGCQQHADQPLQHQLPPSSSADNNRAVAADYEPPRETHSRRRTGLTIDVNKANGNSGPLRDITNTCTSSSSSRAAAHPTSYYRGLEHFETPQRHRQCKQRRQLIVQSVLKEQASQQEAPQQHRHNHYYPRYEAQWHAAADRDEKLHKLAHISMSWSYHDSYRAWQIAQSDAQIAAVYARRDEEEWWWHHRRNVHQDRRHHGQKKGKWNTDCARGSATPLQE